MMVKKMISKYGKLWSFLHFNKQIQSLVATEYTVNIFVQQPANHYEFLLYYCLLISDFL